VKHHARAFLLAAAAAALPIQPLAQGQAATPPAQAPTAFPGQWAPPPIDWKYPVWPNGCSRFESAERVACHEFVASDFGRLSRYAEANRALPPAAPGDARVVFFGDSITDRWSQPQSGGFFPGRPYVNRGIGGQTTGQMLLRFRADVLALGPRAVVILAGTNNLAGNAGPVTPDQLMDNLMTMTQLARLHDIRVVLASILPVADDKVDPNGQPLIRSRGKALELLKGLNGRIARYAAETEGVAYLDYFTAMATPAGTLKPELNDDGLHPNRAGYAVMRPLAEEAIGAALKR
jgi:lysophospholipase L1-like esterase